MTSLIFFEVVVEVEMAPPFKPTPKRNGASFAKESPVVISVISHSAAGSLMESISMIAGGDGGISSFGLVLSKPRPHHSPF